MQILVMIGLDGINCTIDREKGSCDGNTIFQGFKPIHADQAPLLL